MTAAAEADAARYRFIFVQPDPFVPTRYAVMVIVEAAGKVDVVKAPSPFEAPAKYVPMIAGLLQHTPTPTSIDDRPAVWGPTVRMGEVVDLKPPPPGWPADPVEYVRHLTRWDPRRERSLPPLHATFAWHTQADTLILREAQRVGFDAFNAVVARWLKGGSMWQHLGERAKRQMYDDLVTTPNATRAESS